MDARDLDMLKKPKQPENGPVDYEQPEIKADRTTEDLISRAEAIDAIQKAYADTEGGENKHAVWENVGLTNALHIMQDLPSAQPEIVRCRECKEYRSNYHYCPLTETDMEPDDFCSYAERRTDG